MHMADALISPMVGITMLATSSGIGTNAIKKIQKDMDETKIPLMGVMGAFVFAAQMINFAIPGTGSSGHIGGGILLAIILGPYAGFLTMASVLFIQALFFGDGGLLAYGCNVFNLGFVTCFIAYPYIYKRFICKGITSRRIFIASILSAVIGLQLGALSVVIETVASGRTELPFGMFLLMMQPIHIVIGVIEGVVTAAVVTFVWTAKPEIIESFGMGELGKDKKTKKLLVAMIIAAILTGSALSWFASSNPDGLEWAIEKVAGGSELETQDKLSERLAEFQSRLAIFPDYDFRNGESADEGIAVNETTINTGTSLSGLVGGILTLMMITCIGLGIAKMTKKRKKATQ